jgi:hypothetical protein
MYYYSKTNYLKMRFEPELVKHIYFSYFLR